MKENKYDIYYEPQNEDLKELWAENIFVFDTSALLSLYYLPIELRKNILDKTLIPIKDKIWIPHQVMYEYTKNREMKIREPLQRKYKEVFDKEISPIAKHLKDIEKHLISFKDITQKKDSHPYIEDESSHKILDEYNDFYKIYMDFKRHIEEVFSQREKEILSVLENDDVLNFVTSNLEIGEGFTFDETINIIKEGELRYRNTIPPGYKDVKDKDGTQIYGDLIVWKEVLRYAQVNKKSVVLISNDVKDDWCKTYKHQREDRVMHPRHELIKEFFDLSNCRFWMYTFNQFLYNYSQIMDVSIEQSIIDEATSTISKNQPKFELNLDAGSPYDVIEFIDKNLVNIGELEYLKHYRNINNIEYQTEIIGEKGSLKISGGLTSGYDGAGPNHFIRLLNNLGINNDLARMYIKGNSDNIYSFEINFKNLPFQSHRYNISDCPICGSNNWNGVICISCGSMCDD